MKSKPGIGTILALGAVFVSSAWQKPAKQFLNPEGLTKPTGYTHVVTSGHGRMIFVSGQGGQSPDGQLPLDFASQAKNTFENIGRCLNASGAKIR